MTLHVETWLRVDGGMVLGIGMIRLLEELDKQGSLNKAAKELGISYKEAWMRLKKAEALLETSLVTNDGPHKAFRLTDFGFRLTKCIRAWYNDVEAYALREAENILPWSIRIPDEPVLID